MDTRIQAVYTALLRQPAWGIEDIAEHTGLSDEEVRSTLDRLTELSLLHVPTDETGRLVPVSPEVALAPALHRMEAELDARRAKLAQDRLALSTLTSAYSTLALHGGDSGIEHLVGVEAVRVRLMELAQRAKTEVCTFAPGGALSAAALEASRPLDEQNLSRGIRMRTVYLDSVRNDTATVGYADWLASVGGETRTVPALPMRMIVCDQRVAVLPLNTEDSRQGAFLIRYPSIVTALTELFDAVWAGATPLGTPPEAADGEAPSHRELALLGMLVSGLTDEGVARKMGVSLRTVRRNMAELMKRLDSQSRFQAGAEAVRRGWL
ncbi:helix-turn-helix domain-containing protein [Streptomyces sp. NPDC052095]|uniref:helix-turn-helix domain-containing protein n=1 Tax=unclassified Streptomyces TaxID=2593676 RepID=UPI00344DF593